MGEKNNEKTIYYFGYGSNMNPTRMVNRDVHFTERQLAKLTDYQFVLNKIRKNGHAAANIACKKNNCVYGALYKCSGDSLKKLDKFEGVHLKQYKRMLVKVQLHDGEFRDAVTYIAQPGKTDDSLKSVNRDYLEHILCGRDILPAEYVSFLESFQSWCVDESSS